MQYGERAYSAVAAAVATALISLGVIGNAWATELRSGTGMLSSGYSVTADAFTGAIFHLPIGKVECTKSLLSSSIGNTGSSTETVTAQNELLTLEGCNGVVQVLKKGSFEFHTEGATDNDNGTLTSTGLEVTIEFNGFHCIFATSATDLGTVRGSTETFPLRPNFNIKGTVPRTGGKSGAFCGSSAQWTIFYEVTTPVTLYVD